MQDLKTTPMVCASPIMQAAKLHLQKAATSDCAVLITGETGTGKELAAEYIHSQSSRRNKAMVCINCAAIPDTLLESELFGHAKGAFTGAEERREGLLASADGGTVFLDEIGDMSLVAQAKILRAIETKEICRVGGNRATRLDVRFLAASNQELEQMVNCGRFRKDLFFRLSVARIHLPPLRERKEDIPLLLRHYCTAFDHSPGFSEECLRFLLGYDWPGNIRELRNTVEWMLLGETAQQIEVEHLPQHLRNLVETTPKLSESERALLVSALFSAKWNKSEAAKKLHWSRMTLYRKIAKYRISIERESSS